MISDEDVMRMFEQADPARLPDRAVDPVEPSSYLAALRQSSIDMTFTEPSPHEAQLAAGRRGRWAWIGAAAAVTALAIGGVALTARDDSPPNAASGEVSAAEIGVVEKFIGAFNNRDVAAMESVSTDGLTIASAVTGGFQVDELPQLMAWYEAFDWRWEGASCETESLGSVVRCELFERNRLTDFTGVERPAIVVIELVDGMVDTVNVHADTSDYGRNAFEPFKAWVRANYPDDVTRMWTGNRPVLSAESADLFDQRLDEYTAVVLSAADE